MRILVIKPSSLGDIIHGLLVAESIRQQMIGVQIDWIARDIFAPLVRACDTVERVLPFYRGAGLGAFGQLIQDIRDEPYDWVLDMQGLARSGVIAYFSKTPRKRRIGRQDAREGSHLACGKLVKFPPYEEAHAVDILREFLPVLGLGNELKGQLTFALPEKPMPALPSDYLLFFPGSRRAEKEWPRFIELTDALIARGGPAVVWGGDVETAGLENWPSERFLNLTGQTALDALPQLISGARLTVCNDSGPMHLAAAMGQPVLGIFGPTLATRFGPYPLDAPTNAVIEAPEGILSALTPAAVLAEIDALLSFA
ncbi:glycosyltransferase family 9 protein [Cerasicoccus arenae]|uniref:Lipopolysaccharide heptosyltransferase I n=1 Tax=Cerasicoccus arenae TaxID=424488 RepID=A0A8J3DHM9_9BACT|nr:glycosyltransferase family 9 protein [Cerasicoccus arenae]MBK1857243.1 glycosyltransferase family 9 protein [Cerasicoccus arenae]GHC00230.1 lipopolysaccharide heptosyltransferase I [Cerasicoccus arenae]